VRAGRVMGRGSTLLFGVALAVAVGTVTAPAGASTAPDAPTGVTAVASVGQATITWVAPTTPGSEQISGYTATATPGAATCTSETTSCTITGLVGGTAYTFTVTATSAAGTSAPSDPSAAVTPTSRPSAPLSVSVDPRDRAVIAHWQPSAVLGGLPVHYVAFATPSLAHCVTTGLSCRISKLLNGQLTRVTVVAVNADGPSAASSPSAPFQALPARQVLLSQQVALLGTAVVVTVRGVPAGHVVAISLGGARGGCRALATFTCAVRLQPHQSGPLTHAVVTAVDGRGATRTTPSVGSVSLATFTGPAAKVKAGGLLRWQFAGLVPWSRLVAVSHGFAAPLSVEVNAKGAATLTGRLTRPGTGRRWVVQISDFHALLLTEVLTAR